MDEVEIETPAMPSHLSDYDSLVMQIKRRGFKILHNDEPYMLISGHTTNVVILPEDPEKLLNCARAALVEERKSHGVQAEEGRA